MALKGVGVLVAFAMIVVCSAGPTKSKDSATYVGDATGLSQVPKVKIRAEPSGSLQLSSDGDNNWYTIPKGTDLTLICSLTFWGSQGMKNKGYKNSKETRHIGKHILGWAFPGVENQHHEVLRYYPHGRGTTVENVLQISNVQVNDTGNYVCYCKTQMGDWDGLNAFFINVEPPQPTVHVYAVPTFSVKPTSPGENKHYIVKEGSNVTLTCETSFTDKNLLIAWVHPKAKNEFEEKQIHSRHEGMNIKERLLHINNARKEDSGSYTCHTRSLHQKTWSSPNTFQIQVGDEMKVEITLATQKIQRHDPKTTDVIKSRTTTFPYKKNSNTLTNYSTRIPTKASSKSAMTTGTTTPKLTKTTTSTTTTTTTTTTSTILPPSTTPSTSKNSAQKSPHASNQFNVASFFGGMALIVGVVLLVKLIQAIIHKRRQQSYGYLNM